MLHRLWKPFEAGSAGAKESCDSLCLRKRDFMGKRMVSMPPKLPIRWVWYENAIWKVNVRENPTGWIGCSREASVCEISHETVTRNAKECRENVMIHCKNAGFPRPGNPDSWNEIRMVMRVIQG
jgi:hypothetical protein